MQDRCRIAQQARVSEAELEGYTIIHTSAAGLLMLTVSCGMQGWLGAVVLLACVPGHQCGTAAVEGLGAALQCKAALTLHHADPEAPCQQGPLRWHCCCSCLGRWHWCWKHQCRCHCKCRSHCHPLAPPCCCCCCCCCTIHRMDHLAGPLATSNPGSPVVASAV
jgi:hypothetical protein